MQRFSRARRTGIIAGAALLSFAAATACVGPDQPQEELTQTPLPDFREFEAGPDRKEAFFSVLRPLVHAENSSILEDRSRLEKIAAKSKPGKKDRRWLGDMAGAYGLELLTEDGEARPDAKLVAELLNRVDIVPASLALAQAAMESGWGTSRFAREGNNFFGEWCFTAGCGMVPAERGEGKSHEVRAFDSPTASVSSYMRNINTHDSYATFRQSREHQRTEGQALSGMALVETLAHYSELRGEYVADIKALIAQNDLENDDLDGASGS